MELYYDRLAGTYTLNLDDNASLFLGPMTHSVVKLQEYGYTGSQASEAVLQAFFNGGTPVYLRNVEKIAEKGNDQIDWSQYTECRE